MKRAYGSKRGERARGIVDVGGDDDVVCLLFIVGIPFFLS